MKSANYTGYPKFFFAVIGEYEKVLHLTYVFIGLFFELQGADPFGYWGTASHNPA